MKGIPRRQECTRSVYCHTEFTDCLQHYGAFPLHRCFHSPTNTGLVLFNMAGLSSHAQSMLPLLARFALQYTAEGLSIRLLLPLGEPASLTAGERTAVL